MSKRLVYNFENQSLRILDNLTETIDWDIEMFVEMLDNFYVMKITGICSSDNEFVFTSHDNYYKTLNTYLNDHECRLDEIQEQNKMYELDKYIVHETFHFLSNDLCSFCLLKLTKK
jgi:hypothetical protein